MSEDHKRPMLVATCAAVFECQKQHRRPTKETYKRDLQKRPMLVASCAAVCECQKQHV